MLSEINSTKVNFKFFALVTYVNGTEEVTEVGKLILQITD